MHIDIRAIMKKAMHDAIRDALTHASTSERNVEWIDRLYREMLHSLQNLTPNRQDIHEALARALDVDLFCQMLRNDAVDVDDVRPVIDYVTTHLSNVCAPSQDRRLNEMRDTLSKIDDAPHLIATFLSESTVFIDEVVALREAFLSNSNSTE